MRFKSGSIDSANGEINSVQGEVWSLFVKS